MSIIQIRNFLVGPAISSPFTKNSMASSPETKKIELDNMQEFEDSLIDYIVRRYSISTTLGDSYFREDLSILIENLYPGCLKSTRDSRESPIQLAPVIKLLSRAETAGTFKNIVHSRAFTDRQSLIKTIIVYWSTFSYLGLYGKNLAGDLFNEFGDFRVWLDNWLKVELNGDPLVSRIKDFASNL